MSLWWTTRPTGDQDVPYPVYLQREDVQKVDLRSSIEKLKWTHNIEVLIRKGQRDFYLGLLFAAVKTGEAIEDTLYYQKILLYKSTT